MSRLAWSMPAAKGFTLIELLVVLGISALLIGVFPMAFGRLQDAVEYRSTVRTLRADLREARVLARTSGKEVRFTLNLEQRTFGIDGRTAHAIPDELSVRLTIGDVDWSQRSVGSIRFLAGGGATGGSVDIVRAQGDGTRVRVDWLSGRVSVHSLSSAL